MPNVAHSQTKKVPPLPPHRVPRAKEIDFHSGKSNTNAVIRDAVSLDIFGIKTGGIYMNVQELLTNKELIRDIRVELLVCENKLNLAKESLKLESTPTKCLNSTSKRDQADFEVSVLQFVEKQKALRKDEVQKDEAYSNMPEMRFVLQEIKQSKKDSPGYRPQYAPSSSLPVGYPTQSPGQQHPLTANPYLPGPQAVSGDLYRPQAQFNPNSSNVTMGLGPCAWPPNVPQRQPYIYSVGNTPPPMGYPPGGAVPPSASHAQQRPSPSGVPPFRQQYGYYTPC